MRVAFDPELNGLALREIADEMLKWGAIGGHIAEANDRSAECRVPFDRLFYMLLPIPVLPRELYVKVGLFNDDEDFPEIMVVSFHLTSFP